MLSWGSPVGSARQLFTGLIVAMVWLLLLVLTKPFKALSDDAVAVSSPHVL